MDSIFNSSPGNGVVSFRSGCEGMGAFMISVACLCGMSICRPDSGQTESAD